MSLAVRVLMLSWEYPPLVVGGLGRHVEAVARELVAAGHHVQVVVRGEKSETVDELVDGVHVRRAAADPIAVDFTTESLLAWSQAAEHALVRAALPLVAGRRSRFDVVHAHDWLVAQSAQTIAQVTGAPLVTTVHATEAGRHHGWLPQPLNLAIHSVEGWLVQSSAAVIACSTAMRDEVTSLFEVPQSRVTVVPNGIDVQQWQIRPRDRASAQAARSGAPLIAFVGRLVHEKGVQTLLDALPVLRRSYPDARLVIAGTGVHEANLHARARRLRIARSVDWLGFVSDDEVAGVLAAADVIVVPSLYEPFGIVALEAAAARTPLVAADTGGLRDLIAAGVATATFRPGDVDGLTAAVRDVLADPQQSRRSTARAIRVVRQNYTWSAVAAQTAEVYSRAAGSAQ